jgi:hypothetical protein
MMKKDLWRQDGCNLLTDERYANRNNGLDKYKISVLICRECGNKDCMFSGEGC